MAREEQRQQAKMDLSEALNISGPAAPPPGPGLPPAQPPGGMPPGPPGGDQGPSPLSVLPSFRSPPVAAALQGPQGMLGHPAMTRPVGFAEGGFVVTPRGKP